MSVATAGLRARSPLRSAFAMLNKLFPRLSSTIALALLCSLSGITQTQTAPKTAPPTPTPEELAIIAEWIQNTTAQLNAGSLIAETAAFGPIEYVKNGTGPVVLCMHGGPGGYDQSALIGAHLLAHGFTVIGVSRPGYLRTPLLPGTNDTAVLQARAMVALLDALGIEKAAVLGFSAGSNVGFQMALNHSNRVSALVMEGIGAQPGDTDLYLFLQGLLADPDSMDAVSFSIFYDLYNAEEVSMGTFLSMDTDLAELPLQQRVAYVAANPGQRQFYFQFVNSLLPLRLRSEGLNNDIIGVNAWTDYQNAGELQRLTVPTMIVQSRNDTSGNYAQAVEIAARIPQAQLITLEGSGHFCWLGPNTAAWEKQVATFLQHPTTARLTIQLNPTADSAAIAWLPTGGRLQSASSITGPWTDVGTNNPALIPAMTSESRFYQVANP